MGQLEHTHDDPTVAWFKALDALVWVAVFVVVVIAAEWVGGFLVRERIARSARKYLDRVDELRDRNT